MGIMSVQNSEENTFDAIVIGSGISGGYAAMELCSSKPSMTAFFKFDFERMRIVARCTGIITWHVIEFRIV